MTELNCEIFACGRNLSGKCSADIITLTLEGVCSEKMLAPEDYPDTYYDETAIETINRLEEELAGTEMALADVSDTCDNLYWDVQQLQKEIRKLKEIQGIKDSDE